MSILVSDTSVLIDLERGNLLEAVFSASIELAVPDLLFERELRPYHGPELLRLGLRVLELEPTGVQLALEYRKRSRAISLPDSFALALAKTQGHTLLTGDAALASIAREEGLDCHGVLWVLDLLEREKAVPRSGLLKALTEIASHSRCRLPKKLVAERLRRYGQ